MPSATPVEDRTPATHTCGGSESVQSSTARTTMTCRCRRPYGTRYQAGDKPELLAQAIAAETTIQDI
eukprot:2958353-Pyramimonas_sp.AAC.1